MKASEQSLLIVARRTAASHRRTGERRTADLLEKLAAKLERLLKSSPLGQGTKGCNMPVEGMARAEVVATPGTPGGGASAQPAVVTGVDFGMAEWGAAPCFVCGKPFHGKTPCAADSAAVQPTPASSGDATQAWVDAVGTIHAVQPDAEHTPLCPHGKYPWNCRDCTPVSAEEKS